MRDMYYRPLFAKAPKPRSIPKTCASESYPEDYEVTCDRLPSNHLCNLVRSTFESISREAAVYPKKRHSIRGNKVLSKEAPQEQGEQKHHNSRGNNKRGNSASKDGNETRGAQQEQQEQQQQQHGRNHQRPPPARSLKKTRPPPLSLQQTRSDISSTGHKLLHKQPAAFEDIETEEGCVFRSFLRLHDPDATNMRAVNWQHVVLQLSPAKVLNPHSSPLTSHPSPINPHLPKPLQTFNPQPSTLIAANMRFRVQLCEFRV